MDVRYSEIMQEDPRQSSEITAAFNFLSSNRDLLFLNKLFHKVAVALQQNVNVLLRANWRAFPLVIAIHKVYNIRVPSALVCDVVQLVYHLLLEGRNGEVVPEEVSYPGVRQPDAYFRQEGIALSRE